MSEGERMDEKTQELIDVVPCAWLTEPGLATMTTREADEMMAAYPPIPSREVIAEILENHPWLRKPAP